VQVSVVPLHINDDRLIQVVSTRISEILNVSARVAEVDISLKECWNAERNQLNSNWILSQLSGNFSRNGGKVIGVTNYDLYIPILSYVFGEAELGGKAAVISTCRLQDELYGLPANRVTLESRTVKEAIHELGHTLGLLHCGNQECVMHSSTYVEEIDLKTEYFCRKCNGVLGRTRR
jgi:archaemetzincin